MSTNLVTPSGIPTASSGQEPMTVDNPAAKCEDSRTNVEGEEQALESHEVIELQTFSERKAWIEEKIKVKSTF